MIAELRIAAAAVLAAAVFVAGGPAQAGPTPEQKCQAGKNQVAGKYAACLGKARKGLVSTGDAARYSGALGSCLSKQTGAWTKLENDAAEAMTACPSTGDATPIGDFLEACETCVSTAAGGGPPCQDPVACADDLAICEAELTACDDELDSCELEQSRLTVSGQNDCWTAGGASVACAGTGQDGEAQLGRPFAFTNNGDGTITDNHSGLMWEVLSDDGSIHDWNDAYTWDNAFVKIQDLNTASFAGHSDWRVPNVRELQSLVDFGRTPHTIDPVFHSACLGGCAASSCSCTQLSEYWSSTSVQTIPTFNWAWYISFSAGTTNGHANNKTLPRYVRAVRTGA